MGKTAFVTQSYKADFKECRLLCRSIDRFAPSLMHFIFVNDEDYRLFRQLDYGNHRVYRKSTVLPRCLVRLPFRMLGHHFHVSPFTIPVREWIIQQICKLGVFEVIGDEYEAVFNVDSECALMRPFSIDEWVSDGRYMMFRKENMDEPSHDDYCSAYMKLLKADPSRHDDVWRYNFMSPSTCFVRENLEELLEAIRRNSLMRSWKLALCNTYRFSENYTYGIFTNFRLGGRHHYVVDYRALKMIDICSLSGAEDFRKALDSTMADARTAGVWLQKKDRKNLAGSYLDFATIESEVTAYWDSHYPEHKSDER